LIDCARGRGSIQGGTRGTTYTQVVQAGARRTNDNFQFWSELFRGARITKTARGNVTGTVGLPGSGISYNTSIWRRSASIGKRAKRSAQDNNQIARAQSGFINLIRADGILPNYSAEELIARGERICSELTKGMTPSAALINEIQCREFATAENACMFVKRAVASFCPEYIDPILAAVNEDLAVRRAVLSQ